MAQHIRKIAKSVKLIIAKCSRLNSPFYRRKLHSINHRCFLADHCFTVFVDESGCEGFTFRDYPDKGSSDWFIVSAVVTMTSKQSDVRKLVEDIRTNLKMEAKALLHWSDLSHERRVRAYSDLSKANIRFVSVLVNKRKIRDVVTFKLGRGRLYYYAVRLLLERVSWLCRDTAKKHSLPSPKAKVIFEHKKRLKHQDMVDYVTLLQNIGPQDGWIAAKQEDVRIEWDVIDPSRMETAQKRQYAGLQIADLVASGNRAALEASPYGLTEHRYAKMLLEKTYCLESKGKKNFSSYGLKFFPTCPPLGHDGMHWFDKHCRK
jgi:hypothetical protein